MKYYIEIESVVKNRNLLDILRTFIKFKKNLTIMADIVINDDGRIIKCRENLNKLYYRRFAMTDNLKSLVFIALGKASMCWSDADKAGIFESSRCAEIGDRLVAEINSVLKPQTSVEGGAVDNNTQQANYEICPKCGGSGRVYMCAEDGDGIKCH